jgi:hypothetical protein
MYNIPGNIGFRGKRHPPGADSVIYPGGETRIEVGRLRADSRAANTPEGFSGIGGRGRLFSHPP